MDGRHLLSVLLVLMLVTGPIAAQPSSELSSFRVLQLDPSARAAALGGSFAAVADGDVTALFYNPSVPGPATSRKATASYLNHLSGINAGAFGYSHTVRGLGTTVSGGARFVHWGSLEGRNANGEQTGSFQASDAALTMGASRPLGSQARYGMNVHLIHLRIDEASTVALATDLGVLYRVPVYQLNLGASLRNLGTALNKFGTEREELPLDLQLSLSKRLAHLPFLLSVTAYDLTNLNEGIEGGSRLDHVLAHLTLGGELELGEVLRVRGGYNHRHSQELALTNRFDLAGLSGGFGLALGGLSIDYAYRSWSDLGGVHQFTLQADLGAL